MYEIQTLDPPFRPLYTPDIDIHQTREGMVLRADLPGVTMETLELVIEDNVLNIFGRTFSRQLPGTRIVYQESARGDYFRAFIISDEVDIEEIRAELEQGVLTVFMPFRTRGDQHGSRHGHTRFV